MTKSYRKKEIIGLTLVSILLGAFIGLFAGYFVYNTVTEPICYADNLRHLIQSIFGVC